MLRRGSIAKGLVGSTVIEVMGESVGHWLQFLETPGQIVGLVEFLAP